MRYLSLIFLGILLMACEEEKSAVNEKEGDGSVYTQVDEGVNFDANASVDDLISKNVVNVTDGETSFYIGYRQVSGNNQDPILMRVDNGKVTWVKTDYETSGDDSKGYGLIWDGGSKLYAVFSSTGTQGSASGDFRRFASNGWMTSYGSGGGAKVAVIAAIDPQNGDVKSATFLSSMLTNGKSNSLKVKAFSFDGDNLQVKADAWFHPRKIDKSRFDCTGGSSPFDYTIVFTADLSTAIDAFADGCN